MKKKLLLKSAVLMLLALFLVLPFTVSMRANAFTYEYIDEDNNIIIKSEYKYAPGASGWKYSGGDWWFFFDPTDGLTDKLDFNYYNNNGFVARTKVIESTESTPDPVTGIYYVMSKVNAEDLLDGIVGKIGYDGLHSYDNYESIPLYANRVFYVYKAPNGAKSDPYYDYNGIANAPMEHWGGYWSGNVLKALRNCYDVPVAMQLQKVPFSIDVQFLTADGKTVPEDKEPSYNGDHSFYWSKVYYSEPVKVNSPGTITNYDYKGWKLTAGGEDITKKYTNNPTSGTASFRPKYASVQGRDLTLTFIYEQVKAEMPFSSPTPEPTQAPGATATPTPTPTSTPTPAPPTPTSQPTGDTVDWKTKDWYFTTDQGYYVEKIVGSSTSKLAAQSGIDALTLPSAGQTSRDNSYSVGTDSSGNQWYFMKNGSEAILVHPKTYNGYSTDSADIKYITELVFPSTITSGSTTYTVRSIGGGTAYYKPDMYSSPSNTTYYEYGPIHGYYSYNNSNDTSSQYTSIDHYVSYSYGVLGNACIQSQGSQYYYYKVSEGSKDLDYDQNYFFYNTTLKKIVIPDTVTRIEEDAFRYCQALETIEGGANLTDIGGTAFLVNGDPKLRLSTDYKYDQEKYSLYYYYNEEASTTTYTARMLGWQDASFLCDEMIFPYLPRLSYIGYSAFQSHHNIDEVDLSPTVSTIGNNAFTGCKLDRIRIPNASCSIGGSSDLDVQRVTLGTKGYDLTGNTTEIHCAPDSTAMNYGLLHDGYYVLYCGHPVTYHPNGAPDSAKEVYSALNIHYGSVDDLTGTRLTYPNYKQSWNDQYYYSSSACQYQSYLDKDGVLWLLDTTNKTMSVVSPGTTFTEMFRKGAAIFAYDSAGNLWVSGQQQGINTYTDSWGDLSFYAYYSSWFNWRKITLPAGTVKTQLTESGVFALDANGVVWWCYLSNQNNRQVSYGDSPAFKDFWYISYHGDVEESIDSYMACLGTDGKLYYAREFYYNDYGDECYATGFSLGSTISEDEWYSLTQTDGVKVAVMYRNYGYGSNVSHMVLNASGELKLYSGTKVQQTISGYGFTDMEPYTVFGDGGAMLRDAAGNTYLLGYSGNNYSPMRVMKIADAGVGIKEIWDSGYCSFTGSNYGSEYDDYDHYTQDRMYVWTDDGYLTAYSGQTTIYSPDYGSSNTTYMSNTSWRVADVKFKKIIRGNGYEFMFAIAEDGTLWSGGHNEYGQLGDNNQSGYSYGYEYPAGNTSFYLTKTSDRTYTDVYANPQGYNWAIALGTDGRIYYSGYKPMTSYGNGYYTDGTVNTFTALGSEYTWPSEGSLPRLRTGFDYNTVIVSNPFNYPNYEFKGWNTAANGTGTAYNPGDAVELTSALTVYAQWGRKNNVIRYDRNGGSGTMANTVLDYDITTTTLALNKFTREGYEFTGWNTYANGGGTAYADGANITVGKGTTTTLYAQWREIVTNYTLVYMKYPYGTAGNTAWKSKTLSYKTVETVEGQPYTPSGAYTVSYNMNKPSGMSTVPTALEKTSDSTPAPVFSKWRLYTKNTAGEYVYGGRQYAQGDTLTQLTKENGGVVYLYPSWQTTGSYVVLPYTEADGYVFDGWNETADGSGALYPVYPPEDAENVGTYTPVKSTTLYGTWTPLTYTVTLDIQNATSYTQTTVTMTFDQAPPAITIPTRTKYVFKGYFTGADGTGTQYYDENGVGKGTWTVSDGSVTTLYIYWVPDRAVEYNANGGTGTMETTWLESNTSSTVLRKNTFTKTGYSFSYWCQTSATCTGQNASGHTHWADGATITGVTTRVTLYAQWKANDYTVTLSQPNATTGGTTSVTATYDAAMPTVTVPKRSYKVTFDANTGTCGTTSLTSNYTFGGYYTGTNGSGTQYYKGDGTSARTWNIAQNTTLHEKWTSVAITLPTPTKTGYTFLGWYTAASGGTKIGNAGATYTPTADITLYAQWKANDYTVTFDWNFNWDEIGIDTKTNWTGNTKTVTYDSAYGTLPAPTREGYEFEGWYTGEDAEGNGTGTQIIATTIVKTASNHTLYAKWSIRYMESADIWLKTLRKEVAAVASGTPNLLPMMELGDTLLNLTVTTDGFFDYMKITAPWATPIIVDFDDGTFDKANKIWYLPSEDYIQFFAAGGDPTAVRINPGYTNQNQLITVDFYKKDGAILITYKVNVIFIPYDVWKDDVVIGREPTS